MFKKLFRKRTSEQDQGEVENQKVRVKKLKNGSLLIVHGTNAFAVSQPASFKQIRLDSPNEGGKFTLVGIDAAGKSDELASFPSKQSGIEAHNGFMKAYAGMNAKPRSVFLKIAVAAIVGWFVLATITEQMANGGYKFQPQIAMPQITLPELNCAEKK